MEWYYFILFQEEKQKLMRKEGVSSIEIPLPESIKAFVVKPDNTVKVLHGGNYIEIDPIEHLVLDAEFKYLQDEIFCPTLIR